MALIERRETSAAQNRANRASAQKSTGPHGAPGKRQVARNASKRGLLTDLFTESMRDLGEDPGAFGALQRGFADSQLPANLLEEALVADLAKLWWKKARAERAQSAYQVHQSEKLESEHRQKLMDMDPDDPPGEEIIAGTARISKSCATNYHQVIGPLMYLLETVDKGDWLDDPRDLLTKIYGDFPTPRGVLIKQAFAEWLRGGEKLDDTRTRRDVALNFSPAPDENSAPDGLNFQELLSGSRVTGASDAREAPPSRDVEREQELRAALKGLLLQEIREVTREYELYQAARVSLTAAVRLARMAPCGEWEGGRGNAWPLMLRQEAMLARQFDRGLRLLLTLRGVMPGNGKTRPRGRAAVPPREGRIQERRKSKGKGQPTPPAGAGRARGKNRTTKREHDGPAAATAPASEGVVALAFRPPLDHLSRPRKTRKRAKPEKQSRYGHENTKGVKHKRESTPVGRL